MEKNNSLILSLFVSLAFFLSCSSSESDEIVIDKTNYEVPEDGGTITIDIKSNVPYEVTISDNWIRRKSSKTRGTENSALVLEVERNNSGDERVGLVKIVYKASGIEKTVNIHQTFTLNISVDEKSFKFDEYGGQCSFSYICNTDIVFECDDWIILKERITEENRIVQKFEVKALDKHQKSREGLIKFKSAKQVLNEQITIKQSTPLYISEESIVEMYIDEKRKFQLKNETGVDVFWDSSDKDVVDVNDGEIRILKEGKSVISVMTSDGSHSDAITVNALDIVTTLSCEFGTFSTGSNITIEAYVTCTIKNNSKRTINITNVKVHWGSGFVKEPNEESDVKLGKLNPDETTYTNFGEYVIGSNKIEDDITFEWFFTFNGKEYTYNCPYHLDEELY